MGGGGETVNSERCSIERKENKQANKKSTDQGKKEKKTQKEPATV